MNLEGDLRGFHNLSDEQKDRILSYELLVYFCVGTETERLKWFRTINIPGKALSSQELRNAVYAGPFVTDAKKKFSRRSSPAYGDCKTFLSGSVERQDYLETALKWISKGKIEEYMSVHQNDSNANELWLYFRSVMEWVRESFRPTKDQEKVMSGLDWGGFYDRFKGVKIDLDKVNSEYDALIIDDDVTSKKGIYPYILTRDEKYLSIRQFTTAQKMTAYKRQKGICAKCGNHFQLSEMEGDHITPWSEGGKTVPENCQMLCKDCNRRKSNK